MGPDEWLPTTEPGLQAGFHHELRCPLASRAGPVSLAPVSGSSRARRDAPGCLHRDWIVFDIVLHQPEIPPNAGNVIRLAANCGARLHLVEPLGFSLDHRALARAGMDYRELADVSVHADWSACQGVLGGARLFALTTRGRVRYDTPRFAAGDAFVFGAESAGLPASVLAAIPAERHLRLPMLPACRSINLSNAVAIMLYEAWRQQGFASAR